MTMQIVDIRIPPEACRLALKVSKTIVPYKKDIQEYQAALVMLEKANRLAPDEHLILRALGAVQCRLGYYEDALKNLEKSAEMHSDLGNKFNPEGLAFRAMALHGIGQIEEAKATLEQLRENLDTTGAGWRWGIPIFEALLPELEELIEGGRRSFSGGELVAHWTFEEAKNGEVLDSTEKGLNGRLIGNAHIVSDVERGSVLKLPGKGDYVDCGSNEAFDITGAITIAAWTKATEQDGRWAEIVTTSNYGLGLYSHKEDPNHVGLAYWYKNVWLETELDVDSRWHLIVVLYDGQEFALYIDGKLCDSKRVYGRVVMDTGPLYIGQTRGEDSRNEGRKDGLIDDVRIYSYALTADEVKMLYEGKEPPREKRLDPEKTE
jgi:tetratricopeptide (TPR) repeat protein